MERHERQFRGVFIPAEIFQLLEDKKINANEALLLAFVENHVNPKDKKGGCWASNAYFGKVLGKSPRQIKKMIASLKEKKLLSQTGWKKVNGRLFRVLETCW